MLPGVTTRNNLLKFWKIINMSINTPNGVSVIIPTINRADVLIDTINDILLQDFGDFEIIVVDQSEQVNEKALQVMAESPIPQQGYIALYLFQQSYHPDNSIVL